MKFFIDTANLVEIREAAAMGILDGVTTNPTLYGEVVGEDEFGNRYYRTKGGKIDPSLGFERRWVIYNGVAEASTIPPSWHG